MGGPSAVLVWGALLLSAGGCSSSHEKQSGTSACGGVSCAAGARCLAGSCVVEPGRCGEFAAGTLCEQGSTLGTCADESCVSDGSTGGTGGVGVGGSSAGQAGAPSGGAAGAPSGGTAGAGGVSSGGTGVGGGAGAGATGATGGAAGAGGSAGAPPVELTGRIVRLLDPNAGVEGVSVRLATGMESALTDAQGYYTLLAPAGATVQLAYSGTDFYPGRSRLFPLGNEDVTLPPARIMNGSYLETQVWPFDDQPVPTNAVMVGISAFAPYAANNQFEASPACGAGPIYFTVQGANFRPDPTRTTGHSAMFLDCLEPEHVIFVNNPDAPTCVADGSDAPSMVRIRPEAATTTWAAFYTCE